LSLLIPFGISENVIIYSAEKYYVDIVLTIIIRVDFPRKILVRVKPSNKIISSQPLVVSFWDIKKAGTGDFNNIFHQHYVQKK